VVRQGPALGRTSNLGSQKKENPPEDAGELRGVGIMRHSTLSLVDKKKVVSETQCAATKRGALCNLIGYHCVVMVSSLFLDSHERTLKYRLKGNGEQRSPLGSKENSEGFRRKGQQALSSKN
jgi:hypothetical protein